MNIPLDRKLRPAVPRPPVRIDEATAIPMGASLSAVFFDRSGGGRDRMQADQDGQPIPRPFIAAELALRSGGTRHVLFVPQDVETLLSRHLLLRLGDMPAARIDPGWLQLPRGDLAALAAPLSTPGLHRLLRVMLTTGASLFSGAAQAGLAEAIPLLLDIAAIPALRPLARAEVAGRVLVSYSAPGLSRVPDRAEAVALSNGRLSRLGKLDWLLERETLHVLLPRGISAAQIVACPDALLRLGTPGGDLRRVSVSAWAKARGRACGDWLAARTGAAIAPGGQDAEAAAEPGLVVRDILATPAGLLHALVLTDPSRVVHRVVLERQGMTVDLVPSFGADGTAPLTGLAALPGSPAAGETCRIHAVLRSGRRRLLAEAPIRPHDGGIPQGFRDAWALGADIRAPLALARARFRRPAPAFTVQHFGPVQKPCLRILTAIGESADMIRARAAMILAEGHGAPVEVVCTMDEGPLAVGARNALAQAAAIYGIAHRLALFPRTATAAERACAVLAAAGDAPVLLLGADVLPDGPGWLSFWLRRLRRQAALAPALLACDGAIAATREGDDPLRGLPAAHLSSVARAVGRPLADCLALAPDGIARLLAAGAPHPDLKLWIAQGLGETRTEARFPFRRFGAAPLRDGFADALAEAEFALMEKNRA